MPGWNLVSTAVQPLDASRESVISSLVKYWLQVRSWDASTGTWLRAAPNVPSWVNNLNTIDPRYGLWINMWSAGTLHVIGNAPARGTQIPLYTGWNLIGAPITTSLPISTAWAGMPWTEAWTYSSSGWQSATPAGGDFTTWQPGYGYWINVSAPYTLTTP
jgi:hypothetical protein